MSEGNVEVVRRAYECANRRDWDVFLQLVHPGIDWQASAASIGYVPDTGRVGGPADFMRYMKEGVEDVWDEFSIEAEDFIEVGERLVVPVRFQARGRLSGVQVENRFIHVFEFADGKIAGLTSYRNRREALEAAGLSE